MKSAGVVCGLGRANVSKNLSTVASCSDCCGKWSSTHLPNGTQCIATQCCLQGSIQCDQAFVVKLAEENRCKRIYWASTAHPLSHVAMHLYTTRMALLTMTYLHS